MNSEELELSLRTEFEEHLKNVLAEMRQEVAQLQVSVEAEFEKHKSQLSEVFQDFSARAETERKLDAGFSESVVEHLRLARDEGARITATAIAEAEDMQAKAAVEAAEAAAAVEPKAGIGDLRDAIDDISRQTSQSAILKTLVSHAAKFTTRGAFFILKNEHFVGWRVFGSGQEETDDKAIREIFFPVSAETVLGESVRSLSAVESSYGTYAGDAAYLDKLEFGQPERMFAVPLVARGRGVAVLYADGGEANEAVNVEALETMVRVAGLTVEVTASASQGGTAKYDAPPVYPSSASAAPPQKETSNFDAENNYQSEDKPDETGAAQSYQPEEEFTDSQSAVNYNSSSDEYSAEPSAETNYQSSNENSSFQTDYQAENATPNFAADDFEVEVVQDDEADTKEFQYSNEESETPSAYEQIKPVDESYSWNAPAENFSPDSTEQTESYQTAFESPSTEDFSAPPANDYQTENNQFASGQSFDHAQNQFEETASFDGSQFEGSMFEAVETPPFQPADKFVAPTEDFSFDKDEGYGSFKIEPDKANDFSAAPAEPISQPAASQPVRSRFSDRNVDLPIEVTEDERRLHNDARRFARLLVSEIKLYNEQKVKEGRDARDLYERLREAIDRSREMYDKRVQPPVAAKFDYFHYELVNTLAEGEQAKLGAGYSGANV